LIPPVILLGYLALTHTPIKTRSRHHLLDRRWGLRSPSTVYAMNRLPRVDEPAAAPRRENFHLEGNVLVATLVVMMGFSVFLFSYFEVEPHLRRMHAGFDCGGHLG